MLSGIVFCTLLVTSCGTELEEKVFRNLVRICPDQYVPGVNDTENINATGYDSCTDSFRYSSQDKIVTVKPIIDINDQICLFPSTELSQTSFMTDQSFYMVTKPPEHGCVWTTDPAENLTTPFTQPTCNDSEVVTFRRFLPVYSPSTGRIYKNPHCASCNGQLKVKMWQAHATCEIFQAFLNNCRIDFVYPGDDVDIQHLTCFTNSFNKCPEANVRVPPPIDLSSNELVEACSMEHLPKFTNVYFSKNVFCYICIYCQYREDCFRKCLFPQSSIGKNPKERFFTRIIDPMMMSELIKSITGRPNVNTICGLDEMEEVCHEVLCPLGQMMLDGGKEMKCRMESTKWQVSMFVMTLLLEFDNTIDVNDSALSKMFTRVHVQSPWPKTWQMLVLYTPFKRNITMVNVIHSTYNISNGRPTESITHVYLELHYKYKTVVDTAKFVADIKRTLSRPWYLKKGGRTYRIRQTLSRHSFRMVTALFGQGQSEYVSVPFWQLAPDVKPYERVLYKRIRIKEITNTQYNINKLMLCKQVELASTNFNITYSNTLPIALFYRKISTWLLDNEFTNGLSKNFRVCISDIQRRPSTSGHILNVIHHSLFLFVAIFAMLSMRTPV